MPLSTVLVFLYYGKHLWLHNNDIFYGSTGKDEDQVKGDGAIDIKLSQYCTVSYNHFFDCGKCSLLDAGEKTEDWDDQITYHHNWFDHSDERNPRCRNGRMFHVYNNYFDGNGLYGIGMACGSSTFAECNYFRNCQFPVINSAQGTDKQMVVEKQIEKAEIANKGYLSGEKGGVTRMPEVSIPRIRHYRPIRLMSMRLSLVMKSYLLP